MLISWNVGKRSKNNAFYFYLRCEDASIEKDLQQLEMLQYGVVLIELYSMLELAVRISTDILYVTL